MGGERRCDDLLMCSLFKRMCVWVTTGFVILKGEEMERSKLGFTLIELVLWLAIGGGLAAIILPAVQ